MDNAPDPTPSTESAGKARHRWVTERTTFQRVYDVMTGVTKYVSVSDVAGRAACSDDGARDALAQLVEMGIVEERGERPAEYRRNDSYFRWKRIEELARSNAAAELRSCTEALLEEDEAFQERFGAPNPDAISPPTFKTADHDEIHDRWDAVLRWRSVRDDIEVLHQAAHRADKREGTDTDDTVSA
jgi:hypothetical protein